MTILTPGEYVIPDHHTMEWKGKNVFIVRLKRKDPPPVKQRCKDCVHFGKGQALLGAWRETDVCHRKVKANGLYYVAQPYKRACDEFVERCPIGRGC